MGTQQISRDTITPHTLVRGIWTLIDTVGSRVKLLGALADDQTANFYWKNITSPEINLNLNDGTTHKWTVSGSGTDEFYVELFAGGDPGLTQPDAVLENGVWIPEETAGSLAVSEWDFKDNDTLGFSTLYIRLSDGNDPDSKATGFVRHITGKARSRRVVANAQFYFDSGDIPVGRVYAYQDDTATAVLKLEVGE